MATAKSTAKQSGISVSTIKGVKSFNRAGMSFTESATLIPADALTEKQLKALKEEPRLRVTDVEDITEAAE
ncbi:MAG: hypothetical protein CMI13_11185 [Oleibacter sp.]|nr:hypothetical protein [Thalassolituus sp.]